MQSAYLCCCIFPLLIPHMTWAATCTPTPQCPSPTPTSFTCESGSCDIVCDGAYSCSNITCNLDTICDITCIGEFSCSGATIYALDAKELYFTISGLGPDNAATNATITCPDNGPSGDISCYIGSESGGPDQFDKTIINAVEGFNDVEVQCSAYNCLPETEIRCGPNYDARCIIADRPTLDPSYTKCESLAPSNNPIYSLIYCESFLLSPSTNIPTTNNPTTNIPTTSNPTTTNIPTTYIPTTNSPTANPITNTPTIYIPATYIPSTHIPATYIPSTNTATTDKLSTGVSTAFPMTDTSTTKAVTNSSKKIEEAVIKQFSTTNEAIISTKLGKENNSYIIIIGCGIFGALILIVFVFTICRKRERSRNTTKNIEMILNRNTKETKTETKGVIDENINTKEGENDNVNALNEGSHSEQMYGNEQREIITPMTPTSELKPKQNGELLEGADCSDNEKLYDNHDNEPMTPTQTAGGHETDKGNNNDIIVVTETK